MYVLNKWTTDDCINKQFHIFGTAVITRITKSSALIIRWDYNIIILRMILGWLTQQKSNIWMVIVESWCNGCAWLMEIVYCGIDLRWRSKRNMVTALSYVQNVTIALNGGWSIRPIILCESMIVVTVSGFYTVFIFLCNSY